MKWARVMQEEVERDDAAVAAASIYRRSPVRFMISIDNFEHIRLAYGGAVAERAAIMARTTLARWLGDDGELGPAEGGVIRGQLRRRDDRLSGELPRPAGAEAGASAPLRAGRDRLTDLLGGLPPVLLSGRDYVLCLILSVARVPDFAAGSPPPEADDSPCRDPFFGLPPGRGKGWVARYRADMATAAGVLAAIGKGAATPLSAIDRGGGGPGVGLAPRGGLMTLPPTGLAMPPVSAHLACVWQPVRDARDSENVLFYEMCPQLVGTDGTRRDLAEARPALERLGLAATLDRHLADHAIDILEASPDLALGVQISAQSISSTAGWLGLFQRLTGARSVASRLAVSITETSSFPDFGGAIRFVARLQALGCAVGIDNFGMGYTSIRELLALSPDLVCIDPFFVRFGLSEATEGAALEHLAGLAGVMAATVVVKGVSNERQSQLVRQKGIVWQQGDYLGAPRLGQPGTSLRHVVRCRLPDRVRRKSNAAGAFVKP